MDSRINRETPGINDERLKDLILKINDYYERIKKILTDFDDIVQENIQYFDCEHKRKFLALHNENKYNYSIFEKNILSYANDLLRLKQKYQTVENDIATNIINHARSTNK